MTKQHNKAPETIAQELSNKIIKSMKRNVKLFGINNSICLAGNMLSNQIAAIILEERKAAIRSINDIKETTLRKYKMKAKC